MDIVKKVKAAQRRVQKRINESFDALSKDVAAQFEAARNQNAK
jgi:hypothetical protein